MVSGRMGDTPKNGSRPRMVWGGPGTRGMKLGVSGSERPSPGLPSQAEDRGTHAAQGDAEAAAWVWGAGEPAHQSGPAWLWVSVPLGTSTLLLPTPLPLGDPYPFVPPRLPHCPLISSHPSSSTRNSYPTVPFLDPMPLSLLRNFHLMLLGDHYPIARGGGRGGHRDVQNWGTAGKQGVRGGHGE